MRIRRPSSAAVPFYLSDQKLTNLAVQFGVKTGSLGADTDLEAGLDLSAAVPPVAEVSARGAVKGRHSDPGKRERALARRLDRVVDRLGTLPDLERGEDIGEGEWFRFHRRLRFGLGQSDSPASVTAFLIVDHEPVQVGSLAAGLLMNGSVAHVRPPYSTEDLRSSPGSRSGSGTGQLFIWLEELREALEANPEASFGAVEAELLRGRRAPRDAETALSMYRLFARDGWMDSSLVPRLLHGAPCEGVAQASLIAVGEEETTVVMASPLFVRASPLPDPGQ